MKRILFFTVSYILFGCNNSADNQLEVRSNDNLDSAFFLSYNLLENKKSDSVWAVIVKEYIDTITKGQLPKDFYDPCFERNIINRSMNQFKLKPLKKVLVNFLDKKMLKDIVDSKDKFDVLCQEETHDWHLPVDSTFEETNIWKLAKYRLEIGLDSAATHIR